MQAESQINNVPAHIIPAVTLVSKTKNATYGIHLAYLDNVSGQACKRRTKLLFRRVTEFQHSGEKLTSGYDCESGDASSFCITGIS